MCGGTCDMSSSCSGLPRPGSPSKSPRSIPSWIFASAMRAKMLIGPPSSPWTLPVRTRRRLAPGRAGLQADADGLLLGLDDGADVAGAGLGLLHAGVELA